MCDAGAIDLMCFAVAKLARVRAGMVQAIFARLERDGDCAARLTPELLAAAFGWRVHTVERAIGAMTELGVIEDGCITAEWLRNVTPLRTSREPPLTGAERQARWRRNHPEHKAARRVERPHPGLHNAPLRDPSSFSLFDGLQDQEKEKKTRAAEIGDDGFAVLWQIWPVKHQLTDAEGEYRRYRQKYHAPTILTAANAYLADVEKDHAWRRSKVLVNWLRTDPCRDPLLPLALPPRAVASDPKPPMIDWSGHHNRFIANGKWPPYLGPPPGQPGCKMPPMDRSRGVA